MAVVVFTKFRGAGDADSVLGQVNTFLILWFLLVLGELLFLFLGKRGHVILPASLAPGS